MHEPRNTPAAPRPPPTRSSPPPATPPPLFYSNQVLELRNTTFETTESLAEAQKRNTDLESNVREVEHLEQLLLYVIDELSLSKGDTEKIALQHAKQHEDYLSTVFHLNDVIKKGRSEAEALEVRPVSSALSSALSSPYLAPI